MRMRVVQARTGSSCGQRARRAIPVNVCTFAGLRITRRQTSQVVDVVHVEETADMAT